MLKSFSCARSVLWVNLKETQDEIASLWRQLLPERCALILNIPLLDTFDNLFIGVAIEWKSSNKHEVEDDTGTPNINFIRVFILKHFRSAIKRAVYTASLNRSSFEGLCPSNVKIDDFDTNLASLSEKNVARADISVNDTSLMKVLKGLKDLLNNRSCGLL